MRACHTTPAGRTLPPRRIGKVENRQSQAKPGKAYCLRDNDPSKLAFCVKLAPGRPSSVMPPRDTSVHVPLVPRCRGVAVSRDSPRPLQSGRQVPRMAGACHPPDPPLRQTRQCPARHSDCNCTSRNLNLPSCMASELASGGHLRRGHSDVKSVSRDPGPGLLQGLLEFCQPRPLRSRHRRSRAMALEGGGGGRSRPRAKEREAASSSVPLMRGRTGGTCHLKRPPPTVE